MTPQAKTAAMDAIRRKLEAGQIGDAALRQFLVSHEYIGEDTTTAEVKKLKQEAYMNAGANTKEGARVLLENLGF